MLIIQTDGKGCYRETVKWLNERHKGEVDPLVETDEWRSDKTYLETTGAAMCMIMAAHNERRKRGLLGHFATVTRLDHDRGTLPGTNCFPGTDEFEKAIKAIRKLGPPECTTVVLAAAGVCYNNNPEVYVHEERAHAQKSVLEVGIQPDALVALWNDEPDTSVDVVLDCIGGSLVIERCPTL